MYLFNFIYDKLYRRLSQKLVMNMKPFLSKNESLLDIGSGNGYVSRAIKNDIGCKITCVDVIDLSKTGPKPIIYDGVNLPFADKTFTAITILFTLHHVREKEKMLKEAIRVSTSKIIIMEDVAQNIFDYILGHWHKLISQIKFHSSYVNYMSDSDFSA